MQILLADDHTLIRENLGAFLKTLEEGVTVIEASSLPEARSIAASHPRFDLIILDLNMPGMNGLQGLTEMIEHHPDVPTVILSGSIEREDVVGALNQGARGYIPKTISGKAMLSAVRLILSGETYVPTIALPGGDVPSVERGADAPPADSATGTPLDDLTAREREVLSLLVKGLPNKAIARELDLKEITVKVHLQNVFRKLGVSNRAQAVAKTLALSRDVGLPS